MVHGESWFGKPVKKNHPQQPNENLSALAEFSQIRDVVAFAWLQAWLDTQPLGIHGTNGIFTYMKTIFYLKKTTIHVGKYTSPMDGMGKKVPRSCRSLLWFCESLLWLAGKIRPESTYDSRNSSLKKH